MALSAQDFRAFFRAIHGHDPFPWQEMLVERVLNDGCWPEGVDLPTASGKTACLDVGVFTLAASLDENGRPKLPRRIFFVVDRRIVVDAAHERATYIAQALREARGGVVSEVAERLRRLSADGNDPLRVARQRGGIARDDTWVEDPTQPTVVTGTVDQIGSRLLFRGYGPGERTHSVHAATVATDSLILLDEAHCAQPFMQTARWVQRYTGDDWCKQPVTRPLQFVVLSATLPAEIPRERRFPADRDAALRHPELDRRIKASKPAELVVASAAPRKPRRGEHGIGQLVPEAEADKLVQHAADYAIKFTVDRDHRRIAVMVNRVATAAAIHAQLVAEQRREQQPLDADVVLMTGRMRPIDRDSVVERWSPVLQAEPEREPERPVIVVTTQCLEVGADWDFDALITECAALDALRQRFGRLDRLGRYKETGKETSAVILHRRTPGKKPEDDPVYGPALDATWAWLHDHKDDDGCVDFGIGALDRMLPGNEAELRPLLTPSANAPVLLPAHVDLLCQTSPTPVPDPEVAVFLHGLERGVPEARLVFRCDLADGTTDSNSVLEQWLAAVSLVPPSVGEMLTVPLHRLRLWLRGGDLRGQARSEADVESQRSEEQEDSRADGAPIHFMLWRGRRDSVLTRDAALVGPNDIVIVRSDEQAAERLGAYFTRPGAGDRPLDVAEQAYQASGRRPILRVTSDSLGPWKQVESVSRLLEWACTDPEEREDQEGWRSLLEAVSQESDGAVPDWLKTLAGALSHDAEAVRVEEHPASSGAGERTSDGVVLVGPTKRSERDESDFPDEDDTASEAQSEVPLDRHTEDVVACACSFAKHALDDADLRHCLSLAARLHDAGKADERFQDCLRLGSGSSAIGTGLLAKSRRVPRTRGVRRRLREIAGLPDRFRHEMLSAQLAEAFEGMPDDPILRDLVLHLVAAHHGYARPFAPVCEDHEPPDVTITLGNISLTVSAAARRERPAHRLDSGVAERFWRLTRHFGWWGLAYLEALLRLADWRASGAITQGGQPRSCEEVRT